MKAQDPTMRSTMRYTVRVIDRYTFAYVEECVTTAKEEARMWFNQWKKEYPKEDGFRVTYTGETIENPSVAAIATHIHAELATVPTHQLRFAVAHYTTPDEIYMVGESLVSHDLDDYLVYDAWDNTNPPQWVVNGTTPPPLPY